MSGAFAKTHRTIWRDPDFRDLTTGAQWLYWHLFSSPRLTWCGVLDWKPRATVKATKDLTQEVLEHSLSELHEALFIVLDDDTDELIVRSFVRSDAVYKQPKLMSALATAFAGIESDLIAGVLSWELQRLKSEEPNLTGWGEVEKVLNTPPCNPSAIPLPERVSPGVSVGVSGKGVAKGSADNYTSPTPTTAPTTHMVTTDGGDRESDSDPDSFALETPPQPGPSEDDQFDRFWSYWPRKVKKPDARKAFGRAVKRADAETIIDGAQRFATDPNLPEAQFIPHPSTWLNADQWNDGPLPPRNQGQQFQSAAEREMQVAAERHQRIGAGQLGQSVSWGDVFTAHQLERPQ